MYRFCSKLVFLFKQVKDIGNKENTIFLYMLQIYNIL